VFRLIRLLLTIGVGLSIGYLMGFRDAQLHRANVVQRMVERAGGAARNRIRNDIDSRLSRDMR
jgi:hypothetical protein